MPVIDFGVLPHGVIKSDIRNAPTRPWKKYNLTTIDLSVLPCRQCSTKIAQGQKCVPHHRRCYKCKTWKVACYEVPTKHVNRVVELCNLRHKYEIEWDRVALQYVGRSDRSDVTAFRSDARALDAGKQLAVAQMKSNFEISTDPDFLQTPCTGSEPNLRALASTITHLRPLASTVATAASGVEHSQSAVTTRLIVRLKVQWPPRPKKQVSSLLGRHLEDLHHKQNLPMNRPEQVTNGSVSRKQSYAPAAIEIPAAKRYRSRDEAKTGDQWDFDAEIIGFPVLARRTRDTGLDIITDKITAKSKFASFAEFKSAISPEATAPTARQTKAKDCTGPVQPKPEQQIIDLTAEETLPTYSAADVAMDDEEEIEVLAAEAEAASKLAQLKRARLEFRRNKAKDGVEETRK